MSEIIEDYSELKRLASSMLAALKRREVLSGKSYQDMTQRQLQKNSADLTWLGMDIDKLNHEMHAVAVNCGIAQPKDDYSEIDYHPSAFHHYRYKPRKPRCRM